MGGAQEMAARIPGGGGFGREQAAQLHETEGDQPVEPGIGGGFQDAGRGKRAEGAGEGSVIWGELEWGGIGRDGGETRGGLGWSRGKGGVGRESGGVIKAESLELLFEGLR